MPKLEVSILKNKNGKKNLPVFCIVNYFDFCFIARFAPRPIPAAIRKLNPPSMGQAGSSGSQPPSGG
jgi:hypothetical protein